MSNTSKINPWSQTLDRFTRARARERARLANPSELYRGADGLPFGMERNRAIGNAVSPYVAEAIGRAILAAQEAIGDLT